MSIWWNKFSTHHWQAPAAPGLMVSAVLDACHQRCRRRWCVPSQVQKMNAVTIWNAVMSQRNTAICLWYSALASVGDGQLFLLKSDVRNIDDRGRSFLKEWPYCRSIDFAYDGHSVDILWRRKQRLWSWFCYLISCYNVILFVYIHLRLCFGYCLLMIVYPLVSLSTRAGVVYSYGQSSLHFLHPSLQPGNAHGAAIHSEDIRL